MKIVDVISQKGKPILSFEIIPPNRGGSILDIYNVVDGLIEFFSIFYKCY